MPCLDTVKGEFRLVGAGNELLAAHPLRFIIQVILPARCHQRLAMLLQAPHQQAIAIALRVLEGKARRVEERG
ncbi:hypothetical protein ES703_17100 [subsurface metagenome]